MDNVSVTAEQRGCKMTTFGWKRKVGEKVFKSASSAFESNTKDEEDVNEINSGEVDWLSLAPKRRNIQLEDAISKSQRLKQEGEVLAEAERYWEALKKWEDAIQLTPKSEVLYELKAQAYISLNEVYPAITAATKSVELNPLWYVAHQTVGRAHLNLGEVRIATKCFSRAVHLNPADKELWVDDLQWAHDLVRKKEHLKREAEDKDGAKIIEIPEEESSQQSLIPVKPGKQGSLDTKLLHMCDSHVKSIPTKSSELKQLPQNYVVMRD